jgi:hypothetical protein
VSKEIIRVASSAFGSGRLSSIHGGRPVGRGGGLSGGEQKDERRRRADETSVSTKRKRNSRTKRKERPRYRASEEGYYGHYKKVNVFRGWEKWLIAP